MNTEQRGFVIEAFFKNAECVTATQRAFRTRFGLNPNESVPDRKTILKWVQNLRVTGSAMPKKPVGRPKSVRIPENIAAVRTSIEQSPSRSARKHASALEISDRTVRRILHCDLKLHPYKIMVTQELSPTDWGKRKDCCNEILTVVPPNAIVWSRVGLAPTASPQLRMGPRLLYGNWGPQILYLLLLLFFV